MRQKLALIIALAGFAALTALGVCMAGADPSAGLGDSQAANGLTTTPALPSPSGEVPACSNEVDDDGDGLVDLEDPDCESPSDTTEEAEETAPGETKSPAESGSEKPQEGTSAKTQGVQSGSGLSAAEA